MGQFSPMNLSLQQNKVTPGCNIIAYNPWDPAGRIPVYRSIDEVGGPSFDPERRWVNNNTSGLVIAVVGAWYHVLFNDGKYPAWVRCRCLKQMDPWNKENDNKRI